MAPPGRYPAAATAPRRPALRPDGTLTCPARRANVSEDALAGYLRQARSLLTSRPEQIDDGPTGLPGDFEALRWFHLPPACLTDSERNPPR